MTLQEARRQGLWRLIPPIQLFTLVDVILLTLYFWSEANQTFLLTWAAVTTLMAALWWAVSLRTVPSTGWMVAHAVIEAVVFASLLVGIFPESSPERAVVLAAFATGLLAAGGLSKMTLPAAAVAFTATFTAGAGFAISRAPFPDLWVPEILLVAFGLAITTLVLTMSKVFDARVLAEAELDKQKTLVSHLLNEFEEGGSEGLWETDAQGRLTSVSPRLAQLFGTTAEELIGRFLMPSEQKILDAGVPFRNLVVQVTLGGNRWWSLSGRPLRDDHGVLTGWRGLGADISATRLQELEVLRLSRFDSLTGLLNRHTFRTILDDLFVAGAPADDHCLVLIGLVSFKDINESRGHLFGDNLLKEISARLLKLLPATVVAARLDGDEFALLVPMKGSPSETWKSLEQLMTELESPFTVAGDRFEAGFRLGATFWQDATSTEWWLRCADLALRTAKSRGRNQMVLFSKEMMDTFLLQNNLREDLRGCLNREELFLVYQPIVDLDGGQMLGVEALVRWNHPLRGLVSPAVFIPLAEDSELILTLGLWVLEQACLQTQKWPQDISVSVNVSGVQLRTGTLALEVDAILDRVGLDPGRLILEVTESALIKDNPVVDQTLEDLKKRGIRLALDDFGTGYSALSYLQHYPFDKLKIDQSFVRPLSQTDKSHALLGSIVQLARSLGLQTTAEGIEDRDHLAVLRSLGCDQGQGYLFSRPVSGSEIQKLLKQTLW